MGSAVEFVSLYIILLLFWTYLGVALSLSLINLQARKSQAAQRRRLPEMGWPDANSLFPWRLWW